MFEWTDDLASGNQKLDDEHRRVLESARIIISSPNDREQVERTLVWLTAYIREHFEYEERLMAESRYGDMDQHCLQHRVLTQQLTFLVYDFESRDPALESKINSFLAYWVDVHIRIADRALAHHLRLV